VIVGAHTLKRSVPKPSRPLDALTTKTPLTLSRPKDAMTINERLKIITQFNNSQVEQFEALYELRNLINDTPTLDVFCAIELFLHDRESSLTEIDKDFMRKKLYQFPEDLDNVSEILRIRNNGLKGDD